MRRETSALGPYSQLFNNTKIATAELDGHKILTEWLKTGCLLGWAVINVVFWQIATCEKQHFNDKIGKVTGTVTVMVIV